MAVQRTILVVGLVILAALGLWPLVPPAAPRSPGPDRFNLENAMGHVRAIAQRPHPAESEDNQRVRRYLLEQLTEMGLEPRVQTAAVARPRDGQTYTVHNIFVRLAGTESTRGQKPASILLCAHYDSVRAGPGAADDGAGVAAILETLRALRAGPNPRRDVLALLTDGEELGMLGARAFVGERLATDLRWSPPMPDGAAIVGSGMIVLNLEARGTSGPSIMFETAAHNERIIRQFAKATPHPVASSLSYDVYRLMPNDTDFTIFRRAGMIGLNFAFIGDPQNYHSAHDDVQHLDPRSLYHHGQSVLALARHLGDLEDDAVARILAPDQPDAVYFNLPGWLVVYPQEWVWPITIVQIGVAGLAVVACARRRAVRWRGIFVAFATILLSLLAIYMVLMRVAQGIMLADLTRRADLVVLAGFAVPLGVVGLAGWMVRRGRSVELGLASLILMSLLGVGVNRIAPGASYLIAWPAILGAWGIFGSPGSRFGVGRAIGSLLAAAPAMLLVPSTVYLALIAMGTGFLPLVGIVPGLYIWLVLGVTARGS